MKRFQVARQAKRLFGPLCVLRVDQCCWCEMNALTLDPVTLFHRFAVKSNHFSCAPKVQLQHQGMFIQIIGDFAAFKIHLMQFAAIGASSLFNQDNQKFTLVRGLLDIIGQF